MGEVCAWMFPLHSNKYLSCGGSLIHRLRVLVHFLSFTCVTSSIIVNSLHRNTLVNMSQVNMTSPERRKINENSTIILTLQNTYLTASFSHSLSWNKKWADNSSVGNIAPRAPHPFCCRISPWPSASFAVLGLLTFRTSGKSGYIVSHIGLVPWW